MKVGKKAADNAEDVRDQTKKDAKKVAGSAKFIGSDRDAANATSAAVRTS
jgi:hypothetical protein